MAFRRKYLQSPVPVSIVIFITLEVAGISGQYVQQPQMPLFVPSQYGGGAGQIGMSPGYPLMPNPYGTGSSAPPAWNYSPLMGQGSQGSVGFSPGNYPYPGMQSQFPPPSLQSSYFPQIPSQGYPYAPQLSPSPQYSNTPQGYPYSQMMMGTGSPLNYPNLPQGIQIMSDPSQMASNRAVSPSARRTVRILVPVYAPRPPSPTQWQDTNESSDQPEPTNFPSEPSQPEPINSPPEPSQLQPTNSHSDPTQPQPPTSHSDPTQPQPPTSHSDPTQPLPPNPHSDPSHPTTNPSPSPTPSSSDPHAPSPTAHPAPTPPISNASPSSDNSNANNALEKINELIQTTTDSDHDDAKLIASIMDIVKDANRRKPGGMGSTSHGGSSGSGDTSDITKNVNLLINKILQDALASQ